MVPEKDKIALVVHGNDLASFKLGIVWHQAGEKPPDSEARAVTSADATDECFTHKADKAPVT